MPNAEEVRRRAFVVTTALSTALVAALIGFVLTFRAADTAEPVDASEQSSSHEDMLFLEGQRSLRESLQSFVRQLERDHDQHMTDISSVASIFNAPSLDESQERLIKGIAALQDIYEENDRASVATWVNNLGCTLVQVQEQGKLLLAAETIAVLQEALRIRTQVFGARHPDVAQTLINLATVFHQLGQSEKAKELGRQGYEMLLDTLGAYDERTIAAREDWESV